MSINTRKLQISAAVMLLLAGCGGGSNGSPEPLATNTPAAANSTTTVNSTAAAQPAPSQPATTVSQPSTQPAAQPAAPTAPRTDASHNSAQVTPTQPAAQHLASAISATGITGAVLATMLDQHSDGQSNDPKAIGYPQGMANAPRISATQSRDKGYAGERNGTPGGYTPAEGGYTYFTFNGGKDTDGGGDANYDVDQVTMSLPVTNGANGVTLGGTLTATDEPTFSYDKGVSYTGKTETIGYEEQVASASQIFEWKNGGNTVQLSVMVNGKDIADLCWNYDLPKTHRRYCNRWQVPAGWKKGQPLVHLGYTIEDVKSGDKRRWASR